jgi:hypothetical protein
MPVQYRNFYVHKLVNMKEKEKRQYDMVAGKAEMPSSTQQIVRGPAINCH